MTEQDDGVLVCDRSGADVSLKASEELREIATSEPSASPTPSTVRWGGNWCCPADGSPMSEEAGLVRCPLCSRVLPGGLLYQLIEFNAHPR